MLIGVGDSGVVGGVGGDDDDDDADADDDDGTQASEMKSRPEGFHIMDRSFLEGGCVRCKSGSN